MFPYDTNMGIHICFPFRFTQVQPIMNQFLHLHIFLTRVCPDCSHNWPTWAFSYISHLGSPRFVPYGTHIGVYIYSPFVFAQVLPIRNPYGRSHWFPIWVYPGWPHNLPTWALTHVSHLGFPKFFPDFTHMGILIYFLFGFSQVCPIWDPYWYSHLFPICVCPGFTHKISIWAFTFVFHLGLPRLTP